jgi:hypothetical protein
MRKFAIAALAAGALSVSVAGCTTSESIFGGAVAGAAVGGVATRSIPGAIVGAGIGAIAGAILVAKHNDGWCTYRYNGQLYRDKCR